MDLWEHGKALANNPTATRRITNSPIGSSIVRAWSKPSATAAKLGVAASKRLLKAVPFVGDELSYAMDIAAKKGRSYFLNRRYEAGSASPDPVENARMIIKFGWKKIDLSDFDRYRAKVVSSRQELDALTQAYNGSAGHSSNTPCDDLLKVTTSYAYHLKRIEKFQDEIAKVRLLCDATNQWLVESKEKLEQWETDNKVKFNEQYLLAASDEDHTGCSVTICHNQTRAGQTGAAASAQRMLAKGNTALGQSKNLAAATGFLSDFALGVADSRGSAGVTGKINPS